MDLRGAKGVQVRMFLVLELPVLQLSLLVGRRRRWPCLHHSILYPKTSCLKYASLLVYKSGSERNRMTYLLAMDSKNAILCVSSTTHGRSQVVINAHGICPFPWMMTTAQMSVTPQLWCGTAWRAARRPQTSCRVSIRLQLEPSLC